MSQRLAHVLRHVSGPTSALLRASASASAAARLPAVAGLSTNSGCFPHPARPARLTLSTMAELSMAARNASNPIHTAAGLIIGDEVLGGKVWRGERTGV